MKNRFLISIFLFTLFTSCCGYAVGSADAYTQYDIDVRLDNVNHTLSGQQTVTYTNRTDKPLEQIYFLLMANHAREKNPYVHDIHNDQGFWKGWEAKSTSIAYVRDAQKKPMAYTLEKVPPVFQTYSLEEVLLNIQLAQPLAPGEQVVLQMGFSTRFIEHKLGDEAHWQGVYTWRFGWNPVEVATMNGDWFRDGLQMVPAHFSVQLEVPASFDVIAGAGEQQLVATQGGRKKWQLKSKVPQVSVPLTMGPGLSRVGSQYKDISIESWYRRDHRETAEMMAKLSGEIIAYFEPRFGQYRYDRLAIAEISAPLTAMASDGLVLLAENFYRYKDTLVDGFYNRWLEYVLAHEIAHLWWGIAATPDFAAENWLSEAFANYLAYSYMASKYGERRNMFEYGNGQLGMALVSYFGGDRSFHEQSELAYLNVYHMGWDEEIAKPLKEMDYGNAISPRTYDKGYWVIRALENELGRETLFTVLQAVFNRFQGHNLTIADFRQVAEEVSGKSLGGYFDQWVFGKAWLDYSVDEVEIDKRNGRYVSEIEIKKSGEATATARVRIKTRSGEVVEKTLDPQAQSQTITLETDSRPVSVAVDPAQLIPDTYRLNNRWPRKIKYRFAVTDESTEAYSVRAYVLPSSVYVPATGLARGAIALGVGGGYSPTHQWDLMSSLSVEKDKYYFSNIGNFNYRFSARNSLFSMLNATGYDSTSLNQGIYTAELGHRHTWFTTPPLGASSRILLPTNRFANSLVARDFDGFYRHSDNISYQSEYDGSILGWRFNYTRDDTVKLAWLNTWQLDWAIPGINSTDHYQLMANSIKLFRLAPNWTLRMEGQAQYASEQTPAPLKYDLLALKSNFGQYYRRSYGYLLTEIELPIQRELEGSVFNLIVFKEIYASVFANTAALGSQLTDSEAIQAAEAGAQLKFVFTTLGGIVDMSLDLGYVVPLYEQNTSESPQSGLFLGLGLRSMM